MSIQVQFGYLKMAELYLTTVRLSMNILRLLQLMSPSWPCPWMNFLATPVLSMLRRRQPNYYFHPISVARGSEILSNLNVRKSAGSNGISPKLLKIAAPVIAGPMTKRFNYCINVGEWPCRWKLSNVTPVHKKDDETSKKNYRPISIHTNLFG